MGWFFNKNKHDSHQTNQSDSENDSQSNYSFKKSFYSKKRTCQNDPEDDQYMICKTVIKDDNGTTEEEERVPKNTPITSSS